jgi:hypothetical protein
MAQEADAPGHRGPPMTPSICKFFCLPMKSPRSMTFDLGLDWHVIAFSVAPWLQLIEPQ